MRMILMRHALTDLNQKKIINGQINEPILDDQLSEIQKVAHTLPKNITHVYASSMLRTRQTADEVNKILQVPISYYDELRECEPGKIAGLTWPEAREQFGEQFTQEMHFSDQFDYTSVGGENYAQVLDRIQKFLDIVHAEQTSDNPVLVVTHGGIIRIMVRLITGDVLGVIPNLYIQEITI